MNHTSVGKHHVLHASLYAVSERVTGSLLQIHIEQREDAMTDAVRQMHAPPDRS